MKKSAIIIFLILALLKSQGQSYLISFAGIGASLAVDSVKVENLTQGTSVSLIGSDLLSLILTVGINDLKTDMEKAVIICPNPMAGACQVSFETTAPGNASLELYEITGKRILQAREVLSEGKHTFRLSGINNGMYVLKINSDKFSYSAKILSMNTSSGKADVKYVETVNGISRHSPVSPEKQIMGTKNVLSLVEMPYATGDILKFRGKSGDYRAITMLVPTQDQVVTFLYVKCTDADDNSYATVQIGSQVWMAENLNVGAFINGSQEQANNGILEKYCYDDNEENCDIYGALYQWDEMMQYVATAGVRGICPGGFHVATDAEWAALIEYLGGEDVSGGKLKESGLDHWFSPNTGATDRSGFEAFPGGYRNPGGAFQDLGYSADFWSSSQNSSSSAWDRNLSYNNTTTGRYDVIKTTGFTCRCIQDNAVLMTRLCGDTAKTWKLLRDVSTGRYPLEVGPYDHSTIWWAMGYNNQELANRPCMLNDEWRFGRDFSLVFDTKGDYWAEGGIFEPGYICQSTDYMIAANGEDCSAWGNGTHQFGLVTGSGPKLKAIGNGAYIGFYKSATEYEVMDLNPMVQDSVVYNLVELTDGEVDTLIVETNYYFDVGDPQYGGYWRYVLVHYDDPLDEPPIPGVIPFASFIYFADGLTLNFTNTSTNAVTFLWDFGDGATSTEVHPSHTYAEDGIFMVSLTATNPYGSNTASQEIWVSAIPLTDELLQGGAWRVRVEDYSIFVGPGMGNSNWWSVPLAFLDGTYAGTPDDWSCITNDEFIFSDGGVYTYASLSDVRNDGYFGLPNGCWPESALTGNGIYFASGAHTYTLTPASGTSRAIIELANGPGRAAFMGFYKGYYGGENTDGSNPPNGGNPTNRYEVMGYIQSATKEYLFVSVDITADHSQTAAWSVILER